MAVRQQQRRGTAAQWAGANPILSAAEIGYEIDTNKFKIGDGTSRWDTLPYFTTDASAAVAAEVQSAIDGLIGGAPGILDTLKELADSIGNDGDFIGTITSDLAAKAPLASPTFTGTVSGITKSMVGLGSVDNTADSAKPVSTAQASAIATAKSEAISTAASDATTKANNAKSGAETTAANALSSHEADTTNIHGIADTSALATKTYADNAASTAVASVVNSAPEALNTLKELADALTADESTAASLATLVGTKAPSANPTFTGTVQGITKSMVGLGNVDNTSDANKPVSTATQTALDLKANSEDITELSQDAVNSALTAGSGITKTYNDSANTITVAVDSTIATKTYADGKASDAQSAAQSYADTKKSESITASESYTDTAISTEVTNRNNAISTAKSQAISTAESYTDSSVAALTKSSVGLGNVDNTSDANKPVSTATQTALDLKANLASPALTGVPTAPTAAYSTDTTQLATTAFVKSVLNNIGSLNLVLDGGGVA